jgi:hypothetical protein
MLGRSGRCLLVGLLSMSWLLVGQEKIRQDLPLRSAGADHNLVPERRILPPVRSPIARFPINPTPARSGFAQMAHAAGMIFAGTVVRIDRRPAIPGQTIETVAVTFQVESGIRGVSSNREITIREWIGLWSFGQGYRRGERTLLFLYPASKLGLTSCVGGPLGRFTLDPTGKVALTAEQMTAFRTDSVLGGKSRLPISDFALAVRRSGEEE